MLSDVVPTVLCGTVARLGPDGPLSGIDKHPLAGPWRIGAEGLARDAQADRRYHGGPEKALHHYALDHADAWEAEIGPHPLIGQPGAFGENLSTGGWTEATVCLGDIARFGSAVLQVSQARQPCFKLNHRFGLPDMARRVQTSGRTGWYWRVLQTGEAEAGDALRHEDRPLPQWPLARLLDVLYRNTGDRDALAEMAALPLLAESWRSLAARRLASGRVEDWRRRLGT